MRPTVLVALGAVASVVAWSYRAKLGSIVSPQSRHMIMVQSVLFCVISMLSYYMHRRLIVPCQLHEVSSKLALRTFIVFIVFASMGPPLNIILASPQPSALAFVLLCLAGTYMLLFFMLVISDLILLLVSFRSVMTVTLTAYRIRSALVLLLSLVLSAAAIQSARHEPALVRLDLELKQLPSAADGLRLVQLSDLHCSSTIGVDFVSRVVQRVSDLQPDIVVITGDLADATVDQIRQSLHSFSTLTQQVRYGVYFCTGNHDYYHGEPRHLFAALTELGIKVLHNRHVVIKHDDLPVLNLAGIDDWTAHRFAHAGPHGDHGANLEAALQDRVAELPVVLLAHNPNHVHVAAAAGADLVISGHTHGGQIWPMHLLSALGNPYLSGLHRHGNTQIYVSRGMFCCPCTNSLIVQSNEHWFFLLQVRVSGDLRCAFSPRPKSQSLHCADKKQSDRFMYEYKQVDYNIASTERGFKLAHSSGSGTETRTVLLEHSYRTLAPGSDGCIELR
jgi:predicted MPP superfamily phosphohydrolase